MTPSGQQTQQRKGRWRRRLLVLLSIMALMAIFHAPILRGWARILIVNEPVEERRAVVLFGGADGERCFSEAARLYHQGLAVEILYFDGRPGRLAELGILPPANELVQRELSQRNVPEDAMVMLFVEGERAWDKIRRLEHWLDHHPDAHVTIICSQFFSRMYSNACRQVMADTNASRLHWYCLADRRFNDQNWWRSKIGILSFFGAQLRLVHQSVCGEPVRQPLWDPDQYEQELLAQ